MVAIFLLSPEFLWTANRALAVPFHRQIEHKVLAQHYSTHPDGGPGGARRPVKRPKKARTAYAGYATGKRRYQTGAE